MYAYAAFCLGGLEQWNCYWCNVATGFGIAPVNVSLIFESDGLYGTAGYVGATNDSIIVSFRGSRSANNWAHDFEFFRTPYPDVPGVWVHHGFWEAYKVVSKDIVTSVLQLRSKYPQWPIYVTGHSLGAALSTLLSVELLRLNISDVYNWNYGSPRIGNEAWQAYVNNKLGLNLWRVVNLKDIVPHIIGEELGYRHVATEVWFEYNTSSYRVCPSANGENQTCSDSVRVWDPADHTIYLGYQVQGTC